MITTLIVNIASWIMAAISKAIMDKLHFHYNKSIFYKGHASIDHDFFWNPQISWRNKYKKRNPEKGPRFLFSTTVLVFLTDGWHLFQFFMGTFIVITVVTAYRITPSISWDWYW
jgi:hypothetical protein